MKNIRIGNDIKVEWSIFKKGGGVFLLDGLDLIVNIKDKYGCKKIDDFTIAGNVIRWTFKGKDQRRTGIYSLELVINKDEDGMITTDACQFVNLVSCTCDAGSDSTGVHTESIELRSSLIIGGGGEGGGSYDDTAIWKAVNNKVDKEKGKGLSTNDYTDEDREKLAGLENYDDSGIKQDIEDLSKKVEDLEQGGQGGSTPDLSEYLTREEFYEASEGFAPADALEGKQDTIEDLDSIRSGAGKGATAVQPSALADYATTQQLTELSAEVSKKVDADFVNNAIAEAIGEAIDGGY